MTRTLNHDALTARLTIATAVTVAALLLVAPLQSEGASDWYQVNEDGFALPLTVPTVSAVISLVAFDGVLYAVNEDGVFQMRTQCASGGRGLQWRPLSMPGSKGSPLVAVGGFLYQWDSAKGQLWFVPSGSDPATVAWTQVKSTGLPGGVSPLPHVLYQGFVYAAHPTAASFEVYRSPSLGQPVMAWTKVGSEGFGDPANNESVAFMTEFKGKLVVGTNTLKGMFGDESAYATGGVEVWAAASSAGAFAQVNTDGFGTTHYGCVNAVCDFPSNQVIGSFAVYQAPGEASPSLYVGTKSHFGAEIWRWDGTTWSDASQPWSCVNCITTDPHFRNEDMVVSGGKLYLAEGYPAANLAVYDGTSWSIVEAGPNPFDSSNNGLLALAALDGKVYVATKRSGAATTGVQVWAGPFHRAPALCGDPSFSLPDLLYDPPEINFVVPANLVVLRARLVNLGQGPLDGGLPVLVTFDG